MRDGSFWDVIPVVAWGLFWVFGWAGMWMGLAYMRNRSRDRRMEMMHRERMAAMEKGVPLPELPGPDAYLRRSRERNPDSTLKGGIVCMAVGVGAMLAFNLSPNNQLHDLWTLPLPLVFVGFGLLLYHFLRSKSNSTQN